MPPGVPSTWRPQDCEAHIRELAFVNQEVEWSDHWLNRERDITKTEALRVLRNGRLAKVSPAKPPFTGVECVMQYVLPDEGLTSVVVGLSDNRHMPTPFLMVITAF